MPTAVNIAARVKQLLESLPVPALAPFLAGRGSLPNRIWVQ
jgi:hypothetical protein